jgi:hypothetical protein
LQWIVAYYRLVKLFISSKKYPISQRLHLWSHKMNYGLLDV